MIQDFSKSRCEYIKFAIGYSNQALLNKEKPQITP